MFLSFSTVSVLIIKFILDYTGASDLSYIGFSQGTTICFAGLSLCPGLRKKINCFVALAPSTKPHGMLATGFLSYCNYLVFIINTHWSGLSNSFIASAIR
jgi:hypothetical protein